MNIKIMENKMMVTAYIIPGLKREYIDYIKGDTNWIIKTICDYFKVTVREVVSKSRYTELVYARGFCYVFLIKMKGMSLVSIGKRFNRDHSSIIHLRDMINEMLCQKTDSRYTRDFAELENIFRKNEIVV
jgi:chromosomal replication initiation ATPase DnaA